MIVDNGEKTKVLFKDGDRVFMVFDGLDLVYNIYTVTNEKEFNIHEEEELTIYIGSNSAWKMTID